MDLYRTAMSDVAQVLNQISDVSLVEYQAAGFDSWNATAHIRRLRNKPGGEAFTAFDDKGRPLYIFGSYRGIIKTQRATFFAGTQRFFDLGGGTVREMRKLLRWMQERHPGITFISHTASPHPMVKRWYTLIGGRLAYSDLDSDVFFFDPK
jgi:hypothetical protein